MAVGDKAAAAGLTTYTSAQDRRLGYENDNRNADYIAEDRARLTELEGRVNTSPAAILRSSVTQKTRAESNGWIPLQWNIEEFDRGATHNPVDRPTQLVAPKKGLVIVHSTAKFQIGRGICRTRLMRNDVMVPGTLIDDHEGTAKAFPIVPMTTLVYVNAGDVFELHASSEESNVPIISSECRFGLGYLTIG